MLLCYTMLLEHAFAVSHEAQLMTERNRLELLELLNIRLARTRKDAEDVESDLLLQSIYILICAFTPPTVLLRGRHWPTVT